MPQQSSPPYAPNAIIQPRELKRWLDVNPQNGPLARTSTYIVLPAFTQGSNTWNGFSDIIFAYNVESPNSVGLLTTGTKTAPSYVTPANPNYTLCISWRIGGNITRYVVWLATGTILPFDVTPYIGQRLPKNWRFEIWNTSQGIVNNAGPITFYTTALGQIDYRYGSDSALVGADAQCNNFESQATTFSNPSVSAVDWWKPSGIVSLGSTFVAWNESSGSGNNSTLFGTVTVNASLPLSLNLSEAVQQFNLTSNYLFAYFIVKKTNGTGPIGFYEGNSTELTFIDLIVSGANLTIALASGSVTVPNQIVGIALEFNPTGTIQVVVYSIYGIVLGTFAVSMSVVAISYLQVGLMDYFYEIITSNTLLNFSQYIGYNYALTYWPLPLTFPSNSVSTTN